MHDLTAARTHDLIDALTNANVMTFADKAYQSADGTVRTPFKRHRHRRWHGYVLLAAYVAYWVVSLAVFGEAPVEAD